MKHSHLSRKARIGALIAAATLLLTTIAAGAAAIHYNVFDFLNPIQAQPLPEATQLVQTPHATAQAAQSPVSFSVREALYDGVHANVLVAATPLDDSVLLLPADANPDHSVADLGLELMECCYFLLCGNASSVKVSTHVLKKFLNNGFLLYQF